jgi:hypothetical protein
LLLPVPPEHISARVALLGLASFRGFPSLVADIARSTTTLVDHSLPRSGSHPASLPSAIVRVPCGATVFGVDCDPEAPSLATEPDFLSRGRLPLLVLRITSAPWSSCEDSAACSAHLQGFELPKSPYCHRRLS